MAHAFSHHAFGSPIFSSPAFSSPVIPLDTQPVIHPQRAGELGPQFEVRPTPPQFPQASVGDGFGNPAIPMQTAMDPIHMQRAGQFGPHFDSIPPPADFPQASVSGCCGMGDYLVDGRYAPLTPDGNLIVPSGTAGLGDYFVDGRYAPLTTSGNLIVPSTTAAGFGATSGQDKALVGIAVVLLAAGAFLMFKKK